MIIDNVADPILKAQMIFPSSYLFLPRAHETGSIMTDIKGGEVLDEIKSSVWGNSDLVPDKRLTSMSFSSPVCNIAKTLKNLMFYFYIDLENDVLDVKRHAINWNLLPVKSYFK